MVVGDPHTEKMPHLGAFYNCKHECQFLLDGVDEIQVSSRNQAIIDVQI